MEKLWETDKGTLRAEEGPRGGIRWSIIYPDGTVKNFPKSPLIDQVEYLGLDAFQVYEEYKAWKEAASLPPVTSADMPAPPLSLQELVQKVAALDVLDPNDVEVFAQYLLSATQEQRQALIEAHYDALVSQMTGQVSQEILEEAARLAETAADSLLRTMTEADLNTLGKTISQGIAEGLNPRDIARRLEEVQGLDSNRAAAFEKFRAELEASDLTDAQIAAREEAEFQRLLRERRETIARTESAKAVSEGDRLDAVARGVKYKLWQTTGDDRVSDECQANEAAGPIPIDDDFPSGVATAPQHPNCRCAVTYITEDAQLEGARERAEARAERTAAAKNEEDAA
jgi:hypothetical protein